MTRECRSAHGPKRRYPTRQAARTAAKAVPDGMTAYRCSECGWWHIGHRPTSPAGIAAAAARDMKTSSAYRKPRTETT